MEKIDGGNFPDDLLAQAEKATFELMRHSIIPLWKTTALYREALKEHGVKDIREIKLERKSNSRSMGDVEIQMEIAQKDA